MTVITKLKCDQCNCRVNWNVIIPVSSNEVKVECPYCKNKIVVTKKDVNPLFHNVLFGGQDDFN